MEILHTYVPQAVQFPITQSVCLFVCMYIFQYIKKKYQNLFVLTN